LFVFIFLSLLCLFSVAEIWVTNHILSGWFPAIFNEQVAPRGVREVIISGVGNLYILLVFIAVRQVRIWYLADEAQSRLEKRKNELIKAETKAGMQPNMLLYLIGEIEKLADMKEEETSVAIAQLSELLNLLMQTNELGEIGVDEELLNVKKLVRIYETTQGDVSPQIVITGENLPSQQLPAFILFTPLEIVFRTTGKLPSGNIDIMILRRDEVCIRFRMPEQDQELLSRLNSEMEQLFPGKFMLSTSREMQFLQIRVVAISASPSPG
jgi:hypothetical protein